MKVTQEDIVQRQTVLHIELEEQDLEKYLDRAYRRVVQRVNVPGFRKGKAPRTILERLLGQEALLNEAMDFLATDATAIAMKQQNLEAAIPPQIEVDQLQPAVQLKATVPLVPVVELNNHGDIRLAEDKIEVTEEQVQQALEQLRRDLAPWEPVERPVVLGDMLTINVKGTVAEQTILDQEDATYIADVENPRPFPGFSEQLVGLSKGQSREFTLQIPGDYPNKDLAGKECLFQVNAKEIKERKLPEVNDEFAKGVGEGFDSLSALHQKLRESLEARAKDEAWKRYRDTVVETFVQNARIELPPLMIEREIDHVLADREEALKQYRLSMDQYLSSVGKTQEQLREEARETAIKRLSSSLVLSKVAELEQIQVSPEEVESRVEAIASESQDGGRELRRVLSSDRGKESILRALLTGKAIDRLMAIARGEPALKEPQPLEKAATTVVKSQ